MVGRYEITAELLSVVYHSVPIEPHLQPMEGEGEVMRCASANVEDGTCLDIAVNGSWKTGRFEQAIFDVKLFNPFAPTNC